ncbi:MAG: MarR family transcriptional regulator [Burkholderiaceae bacterium]
MSDSRQTKEKHSHDGRRAARTEAGGAVMALSDFLPYQLAVAAEAVSRCVADVYTDEFDLARDEWRVLAALGETGEMNTKAAQLQTTLDKVQASRAIARLERKDLLTRHEDPEDRRNHVLRLTRAGRALYRRLVPRVLTIEQRLLTVLNSGERAALDRAMTKLLACAAEIRRDHERDQASAG